MNHLKSANKAAKGQYTKNERLQIKKRCKLTTDITAKKKKNA